MSKTAVYITHIERKPCLVHQILLEEGYEVSSYVAPQTDFSKIDPLEADLWYFGGGPMGVYEADKFPYLYQEIEIIKRRLEAGRAVIGICLGSQLMAKALGADVHVGPKGIETGWKPLKLHFNNMAADHPVRHFSGDKTHLFFWHQDTYTLPENVTLLASTDQYNNQIFEYGRHAIAIQAHPEIYPEQMDHLKQILMKEYLERHDIGMTYAQFLEDTDKYVHKANKQLRLFVPEFLERAVA